MSSKHEPPAPHHHPTSSSSSSSTGTTVLRAAMALESCFNLFLAHGMLFHPHATATQLFLSSSPSPSPSTTTTTIEANTLTSLLTQWIGVWTLATTVPLLLALPDGPGAREKRFVAYATLAAMEALWVPLLAWRAKWAGDGVLDWGSVVGGQVGPMVGCLAWRGWVLFGKPGWMDGVGG